jgi:HEPN domain-containing protein
MSVRPEVLDLVRQWVSKAEEDLSSAEYLITMPGEAPYGTVCFHAQQCLEKYLKASLIFLEIEFPRVHDLGVLLSLLPQDNRPSLTVMEEERLTDYASVNRYPGDYEPITRQAAEEAVAIARRVRQSIQSHLPSSAFPG